MDDDGTATVTKDNMPTTHLNLTTTRYIEKDKDGTPMSSCSTFLDDTSQMANENILILLLNGKQAKKNITCILGFVCNKE